MNDWRSLVESFFARVGMGQAEIYNEFSLQHELGLFLRSSTDSRFKVQFERHARFFGLDPIGLLKKEIDITVFTDDQIERYAFELKYPRAGQYPEQMFKACEDIAFLEQLVTRGFSGGYFVLVGDYPLRWDGREKTGVYSYFRASEPIHGRVWQPTGNKAHSVQVTGSYSICWRVIDGARRYALVEVVPGF